MSIDKIPEVFVESKKLGAFTVLHDTAGSVEGSISHYRTGEFPAQGLVTRKMFPFDDVININGPFSATKIRAQTHLASTVNHRIVWNMGNKCLFMR